MFSGYERLPYYMPGYKPVISSSLLSKLLKRTLKGRMEVPVDYLWSNSSKEIKAFLLSYLTGNPIHFLYADKDAVIVLWLKKIVKTKRVKVYGTFHWPLENFTSQRLKSYAYFNKVIVMGNSLQNEVRKYTKNVKYIPHGINLEYWQSQQIKSKVSESYGLVLGVSNRNHNFQRNVIDKIVSGNNIKFKVLVHDSVEQKLYQSLNGVEVLNDFVSDSELKELIGNSKFVLLLQNHCIASNLVLESMAMGVPVIANNVGDITDYLGIDYPLFIPEENYEEKLKEVFEILNNDSIEEYIKNRVGQFSWNKVSDQTSEFLFD